jgi:ferritin-like metal-binding protein YciE
MVTFVGNQENFLDALKELVELEYAAVEAYQAAVDRLKSTTYREKLKKFQNDHERHIKEISDVLEKNNQVSPQEVSIGKQLLTKGKVILANMVGDDTILRAMKSNEIDTNTAYERMNSRKDIWPDAQDIIKRGLQDEKMHKEWLEATISSE